MHCPCYQFFTGPRFSEYQDVGVGGGDFLNTVEYFAHRLTVSYHAGYRVFPLYN